MLDFLGTLDLGCKPRVGPKITVSGGLGLLSRAFSGVCVYIDVKLSVSMGSAHCPYAKANSAIVHYDPDSAGAGTLQFAFECVDHLQGYSGRIA